MNVDDGDLPQWKSTRRAKLRESHAIDDARETRRRTTETRMFSSSFAMTEVRLQ